MENRISIRPIAPTAAQTQPLAPRGTQQDVGAPPVAGPQDAVRFSAASTGSELAELRALITALTERLDVLEAAVGEADQPKPPSVLETPAGLNLPPLPLQSVAPAAQERVIIDPLAWRGVPMEAVQMALGTAKLENLTSAEKKTVERALERVRQIGLAIHRGDHPGPLQAELFALKQTLAAPRGAGRNTVATSGAQLLTQLDAAKNRFVVAILAEEKAGLQGLKDPAQAQANVLRMNSSYRVLVQIERLLFSLNLVNLTPENQRAVLQGFSALRDVTAQIDNRKLEGVAADARVAEIAAGLQAAAPAQTLSEAQRGAEEAVTRNKLALQEQLRALDEKQFTGTAPEVVAADRARLLAAAEALMSLSEAVSGAKPQVGSAAERRETEKALLRAATLADALGTGQQPADLRNTLFVTTQSLKDPVGSQSNPAIQAAAGALQVMGLGEKANVKAREEISDLVTRGMDPRIQDARAAQLSRQAEDLEAMRLNLETVDYAGLTPDKAPRATALIGQMQGIAQRVANGEDYAKHRAEYETLGRQLRELAESEPPVAPVVPIAAPPAQPLPPSIPAGPAPEKPRVYTVKSGDYLVKIAREQLGDGNRWRELVELNQAEYPSLKDNPGLIHPNWKLKLPPREAQPSVPGQSAAPAPVSASAPAAEGVAERGIEDLTHDGVADSSDVPVHAAQPPADSTNTRAQADLAGFLTIADNRQPQVLRAAIQNSPEIFQAATSEQKAEVVGYLMKGFTGKDNRTAALKVMEMAAERSELNATLEAAGRAGTLKTIFTDMGDHSAGVRMARLLAAAQAYENPVVWRAMDDDAVRAFLKALDFKRPMIGTSDALRNLSEDARHHMIDELTGGHVSQEELDMAKWINLHNTNKVEIREYDNATGFENF